MKELLLQMKDGGIVNYYDDCNYLPGCPTCDYGSEYINNISMDLTKYKVYVETKRMYRYALTEAYVMRLFLTNYETIKAMTENEFIEWFKKEIEDTVGDREETEEKNKTLKEFSITEKKEI